MAILILYTASNSMNINVLDQDFSWTADGDLYIGNDNGTLTGNIGVDNSNENSLLQSVILRRLMSRDGDWAALDGQFGYCANLTDFVGLPVDEETCELIRGAVTTALISPGGVRMSDVEVNCYPSPQTNSVLVIVTVSSIDPNDPTPILVGLSYDVRDNKIVPRITNI